MHLRGAAPGARRAGPVAAARLRPSDRQRIVRALEIFEATGRSLFEWQEGQRPPPLLAPEHCVRLFLEPARDELRQRIERRFDAMLAEGALEEIRRLAARRLDPSLPAMRAHGVPWLLSHLRGEIGLEEAAEAAKADTRRYARRQFTWFRHQMPGWSWQRAGDGRGPCRRSLRDALGRDTGAARLASGIE